MPTYISLLRGINVSGQRLIKMEALRVMYEKLGFQNVKTYVQSGNVVFTREEEDTGILEKSISEQIKKDFGFTVPVLVLTVGEIRHIIENNPFAKEGDKAESALYTTFLFAKPSGSMSLEIERKKQKDEMISFSDNVVYLYCPNGYGRTRLNNNFIESCLKVSATTRNWKTTVELLKIAAPEI